MTTVDDWTPETDLGTPYVDGETVGVTIDGRTVDVPAGTSVMRAAALAGIEVPKLCATDSMKAFGSCRMCLVEVEDAKGVPASCTTPCADGMVVHTDTEQVQQLRQGVMELYLSDHPTDCDGCARGNCEIQALATRVGSAEVRYGLGQQHVEEATDASNPYFDYDPAACIVCSRCVRACSDIQGTFALTVEGRGFDSRISAGGTDFLSSECVSCGACVQACPTDALAEKSLVDLGMPTRSVDTTCAYCGVGCSFRAEVKGEGDDTRVVRMVPSKDGGANEGHSCVKGRFAYGYASHDDRQMHPMVRDTTADEWRVVSWEEAIGRVAEGFRAIQAEHGVGSIGGISSSRCTNEEVYVVQKMVRAAFGNNNIDTCARVCHSPTGYGLNQTFGTSAGTQDFKSVESADVVLLIGANPTDAHPVFASRMKKRLRAGAQIVVADPRRIDLVRTPHVEAAHHLPVLPGSNVAFVNAMAHTIVTEGLHDEEFLRSRCEGVDDYLAFIAREENSPESTASATGVPPEELRAAARLYAGAPNAAIYYGLGVTEHSQGSTMVMGMANLAMVTGNIGREGVGVNPLRGQNNVQGSCDMGSFPHELPGYRHVSRGEVRDIYESLWGVTIQPEPGLRIPNMFDSAIGGSFRGLFVQGEDIAQSDPNTQHVEAALSAMDLVVVQDLFLNETARFAHVFLPGSSFLEKDGTFTNAERRINRVRPVFPSRVGKDEWRVVCEIAQAMGYDMHYDSAAEIMDEIAATTPTFAGVSFARLDAEGSMQWPVNDAAPHGTPTMHVGEFVRGKGHLVETVYVPTTERTTRRYPLVLTTGRILSQYNVGAQTRRTANQTWHPEDVLEIHPADAEVRGISTGDRVELSSRVGTTTLTAVVSERMPAGVVYTTFHHPVTGANVVTTENSDWATNCPEYKVTAVQVGVANAEQRADGAAAQRDLAAQP
ncbi:formate dehydrogenase subunit alpha [Nocardioides aestuarii]|uniref:Formate dehydrogenase subunit alpha n=1 Tax=Nocardioides aestuarii TaxID=252231 RepID=A0ABW4TNT5_9ACTN